MGILLDDISPVRKKPGHVLYDTLDDRREIFHLLSKLPPTARLGWLSWACRYATLGNSAVRPVVAKKTRDLAARARWDSAADCRLTHEIYRDLFMLDVCYRVDFEVMLRGLEQTARKCR